MQLQSVPHCNFLRAIRRMAWQLTIVFVMVVAIGVTVLVTVDISVLRVVVVVVLYVVGCTIKEQASDTTSQTKAVTCADSPLIVHELALVVDVDVIFFAARSWIWCSWLVYTPLRTLAAGSEVTVVVLSSFSILL